MAGGGGGAGGGAGRGAPRPRGRAPKGKEWDDCAGRWVAAGPPATPPPPAAEGGRPTGLPEGRGGDLVVSFGKFRGRTFEHVRKNEPAYLAWCRGRSTPSPAMRELVHYADAMAAFLGTPTPPVPPAAPAPRRPRLPGNKAVQAAPDGRRPEGSGGKLVDEAAPEEWWRARDAPFPPEFAGEYSGRARIEQPVRRVFQGLPGSVTVGAEQGARYLWAGRDLGGEEAFKRWAQRLEERFPCRFSVSASGAAKPLPETAKSGKVHPWETGRDRTDGCRKATVACWEAADRQALRDAWRQRFGSAMPEALGRTFRVDMFGNVIADPESAAAKSVCAFEVDHIFPWSRGGRTLRPNLAPVQWGANIRKSDKLLHGTELGGGGWDRLRCGLPVEGFLALHDLPEGTRGSNRRSTLGRLRLWLTNARVKGSAKGDLRGRMGPLLDGGDPEGLRQAFLRWDLEEQGLSLRPGPLRGVGAVLSPSRASRATSSPPSGTRSLGGDEASVRPAVLLTLDRRGHAHVQGEHTYFLRGVLRDLGFGFRREERLWTLKLGQGSGPEAHTAAFRRLETALRAAAAAAPAGRPFDLTVARV